MQRKMRTIGIVACVLALVIGGLSFAQPRERGQRGGPQDGAGPGARRQQFDPSQMQERMAEMRQRMMENWRQELDADTDAWKVIEPRLTRVIELNRPAMGIGRAMFPGAMGGRAGGMQPPRRQFMGLEGDQHPSVEAEDKALDALGETLENPSATPEQIRQGLTALRAAREARRQALATSQKELREILTLRQEAILIMRGILTE